MNNFVRSSLAAGAVALLAAVAGCGGNSADDNSTAAPAPAPVKTASAANSSASPTPAAKPATSATAPASTTNAASTGAPAGLMQCPVTGSKFPVAEAYNSTTYKGKTYYFCCPSCKPKFEKTPDKYIANAAQGKFDASM